MSFKSTVNLLERADALPVNCRISGGALRPALNAVGYDGSVPEGVLCAGYSEAAGKFLLCTNAAGYASGNGESFVQLTPLAGQSPFFIQDYSVETARALMINGKNVLEHTGNYFKSYRYGENLRCGIMHCGRLFGANADNGYRLHWSGEGGIGDTGEEYNGSGYMLLEPSRGEILNLVEFGEKLIAVRKYGLTVMNMFGSTENFSVDITNTDTDEIFKNSAAVAGGKLIFFTASGLHSFDGSQITLINHRCAEDISAPSYALEFGGNYFLICRSKSLNAGAILCYRVGDGESYLIDFAAEAMCTAECVYAYGSSGVCRLEEGGSYSFRCGGISFGSDRQKTVTAVYLEGGAADIEICNGDYTRKFKNVSGLIRPHMRGRSFTVKVSGSKPVYQLTVTAEECNGI